MLQIKINLGAPIVPQFTPEYVDQLVASTSWWGVDGTVDYDERTPESQLRLVLARPGTTEPKDRDAIDERRELCDLAPTTATEWAEITGSYLQAFGGRSVHVELTPAGRLLRVPILSGPATAAEVERIRADQAAALTTWQADRALFLERDRLMLTWLEEELAEEARLELVLMEEVTDRIDEQELRRIARDRGLPADEIATLGLNPDELEDALAIVDAGKTPVVAEGEASPEREALARSLARLVELIAERNARPPDVQLFGGAA